MINRFAMIIALDEGGGFSKENRIPWMNEPVFREDQKKFKELTNHNAILMGRKTYEEIHEMKVSRGLREDGPLLRGRTSFVLSRNSKFQPFGAIKTVSFYNLGDLEEIQDRHVIQTLFVIGGLRTCNDLFARVSDVYCTIVKGYYNCDKKFPIQEFKKFNIVEGEQTNNAYYIHYVRGA